MTAHVALAALLVAAALPGARVTGATSDRRVAAALPGGDARDVSRHELRPSPSVVAAETPPARRRPVRPPGTPGVEPGDELAAPPVAPGGGAGDEVDAPPAATRAAEAEAPPTSTDGSVPPEAVPLELVAATAGSLVFGTLVGLGGFALTIGDGDPFGAAAVALLGGFVAAPAGAGAGAYLVAANMPGAEPRLLWTMLGAYGGGVLAATGVAILGDTGHEAVWAVPLVFLPIGATMGAHLGAGAPGPDPADFYAPEDADEGELDDEEEDEAEDDHAEASRFLPRTPRAPAGASTRTLVVPLLRLSF